MTATQTVHIPADHKLTIDVPREVPEGPVLITFTPVVKHAEKSAGVAADDAWFENGGECPLCKIYNEPNEETIAAFEEGDAMLRGEKPAHWHKSIEDLDKILGL